LFLWDSPASLRHLFLAFQLHNARDCNWDEYYALQYDDFNKPNWLYREQYTQKRNSLEPLKCRGVLL
jgi:hypothetical protein